MPTKLSGHDLDRLAVEALVSRSSVNRWRRDPDDVSPYTRARIERAAAHLGLRKPSSTPDASHAA
jgi:DNA-binding LacI/PurR family transcriptional regulator